MVSSSYPGSQGQPGCAPCVGPVPVTVTGYLIRPAETWPTVHSTLCPLPPRSPSVYRNLRMLRSEPGPVTADKRLLRVSLAVVISYQLTALAYLSVADTTLQERLRPLSQSPDVQDSSQDQCSNCSLRALSNFTCSLYTVRLLGANCELSPLGDFHIHKNSRNTFWSEKYIFLLFPNSHFYHECYAKKCSFQI